MQKIFALALATGMVGMAAAQTPATNPMPDGSRDMYIGLGAGVVPDYEGSRDRKIAAVPVLQVQWSNGVFVSGMNAGMHLSERPGLEYGPLVNLHLGRDRSGTSAGAIGTASDLPTLTPDKRERVLDFMDPIDPRLEVGGFVNYYITPRLRLTNNVLYGAGNDRDGARWVAKLQSVSADLAQRHRVSFTAGFTFANRAYNQTYFGISFAEAARGQTRMYAPGAGIKDVHASVRWNWNLSPSWLLTSTVNVTQLRGDAAKSPLAERKTNAAVITALAYRF
jgi:outer membrane scaffolding protein for murein synthesis (MipA/OmpV family)